MAGKKRECPDRARIKVPALSQNARQGPDNLDQSGAPTRRRYKNDERLPFSVSVLDVYEGPLDLLLDLIRKQDIDIYDIPIAKITAQYLTYVERLRELDVNVAADFIYMAAVLIHIKSKMLLPRDPAASSEEPGRSAGGAGEPAD